MRFLQGTPFVFRKIPYLCGKIVRHKHLIAMHNTSSRYINANGRLIDLSTPLVMGILNLTPDSFYAASRMQTDDSIALRARQIVDEGGGIIDVGAYSSRPGAADVSPSEEMSRLRRGLSIVRRVCPEAVLSVDTFRADVARMCVEEFGVDIVNDISAGALDADMFATVARLGVPYVLMHMQGTPQTMQAAPTYVDPVCDVLQFLATKLQQLREAGVCDIIVDPGFGFGKTLEDNYRLLACLDDFRRLDAPLLVGVSRKSMIYKLLGCAPEESLNGTTVLHTLSLCHGADILRVHDVRPAVEAVKIVSLYRGVSPEGAAVTLHN